MKNEKLTMKNTSYNVRGWVVGDSDLQASPNPDRHFKFLISNVVSCIFHFSLLTFNF